MLSNSARWAIPRIRLIILHPPMPAVSAKILRRYRARYLANFSGPEGN